MSSLKEVRNRIKSVSSTQQITKAMKMVAAAKLRRAQDAVTQMRPYAQKLKAIMANVSDTEATSNPYAQVRAEEKILLICITSDRGLCGAFNSNVLKATNALIAEKYAAQAKNGNVTVLCMGKKGNDYFTKRNLPTDSAHFSIFSKLTFESVKIVAEKVMSLYADKTYDKVEIIYNEFKNVATQFVRTRTFLPLLADALPATTTVTHSVDYIFEPDKEEILQLLIPKSLKISFYESLLESNASEQGARMTAMDKATENAGELLKDLRLTYNRTRQAAITKEILEIVGGAEALSSGN